MIVLYILAAVIGVIALLLFCRVYVSFSYGEGNLALTVRYALLRIRILPAKEKKIKPGDYTFDKVAKRKLKQAKKEKEKSEKAPKKSKPKKKRAEKKPADESEKKENKNALIPMIPELIKLVFDVLKRAPRKLRLEINRLRLSVGAENAADTAIRYGAVTQAVGAALTLAEEHADVRVGKDAVMTVPNFLSGKTDADISVRLSVRVGSVLGLGLRFVFNFLQLFIKLKTTKNSD